MFGNNLKKLRENKNLLQKELAEILNVTSQTVSGWEIGRTQPEYQMLLKIANFFEVSVDYLLGNDSENLKEIDTLKKLLLKSGFMENEEDLTNEELDRIIKFINANKDFLKNKK